MFLLGNSTLSIKEISVRTGFRHVSHFSKLFRDTFGMPPSAFRYKGQEQADSE